MLHRRSTAISLVAVLLPLAAALTSCGFDYPTDRVNTIAAGVNDRDGEMKVLGARVVAYADGQGRLIGALVYSDNNATKPASLTSVTGDGVQVTVPHGIDVQPTENLNLASDTAEPVKVEGDFSAGDVLELHYTFSDGEGATLDVPVVKPCRQYAEITEPDFGGASASSSPSMSPSASAATEPSDGSTEADDTYLCDHPTPSTQAAE
jgi:hypothetical protein